MALDPARFDDASMPDLGRIFIGRQQQLDLFRFYLERWLQRMRASDPDEEEVVTEAPSPNHKLPGLVALIYGHGGFGKSTLLIHYRDIAQQSSHPLTVNTILDWEFAIGDKRGLFNPSRGQEIDAAAYLKLLCTELARVLKKRPDDFKQYQKTVKVVADAQKDATQLLDGVLRGGGVDDRYATLRWLSSEGAGQLMRLVASHMGPAGLLLTNEQLVQKVKDLVGKETEVGVDQLVYLYHRLKDRLGSRLGDYLTPALRLGLALGSDLRDFARNYPMLLCFDTYEEVDEGDAVLRIVMRAAGMRVGWVLAGRDNLWAGLDQRERSIDIEYGYKDIVRPDCAFSVNFNASDVGAFTISDIAEYFRQLCGMVPTLPGLSPEGTERILQVTRGVPLAVKIAAGLYIETADLDAITEHVEGKREIVDQMVRRYLMHARDNAEDRSALYALALLRRADNPVAVAYALNLKPEEATTSYASALSRLQRRYSFIFTEKDEPSLHEEVRHFLRCWLLDHRRRPDISAINTHLKDAHERVLQQFEDQRCYACLKDRMQDDEWAESYLDLSEQYYWLDPVEGLHRLLPFMLAAAIYRRPANKNASEIGKFFHAQLGAPYRDWWQWADQSLVYLHSRNPSSEELSGLAELEKLVVGERFPGFPQPLPADHKVLEIALWWRLAEACQESDMQRSLSLYEQCLREMAEDRELKNDVSDAYYDLSVKIYEDEKYEKCITLLNRAIELKPDDLQALIYRGNVYRYLKEYRRAIAEYDRAIALDPHDAMAYNNRGIAYSGLKEYERAIAEYDRAIALDPHDAAAYYNRGNAYRYLKEYERAIAEYERAIALDPKYVWAYYNRGLAQLLLKQVAQATASYQRAYVLDQTDINAAWMAAWTSMERHRVGLEVAERLAKIALIDPQHYIAYICRGVASGLRGQLKPGLAELEQAIPLDMEEWDAYFWQGMLCAYYYLTRPERAVEAIEKALAVDLPPILLTPLYWLAQDNPSFFTGYARPILDRYEL